MDCQLQQKFQKSNIKYTFYAKSDADWWQKQKSDHLNE